MQDAPRQFRQTCTLCHGSDAAGTDRAPTMVNSAHLRSMTDSDIATAITKGKGKMPAFPLPQADIDVLVRYIRSLNVTASTAAVAGDAKAGERIFFGDGQCSSCHVAGGRGSSNGPDLSGVARRLTLTQMLQSLSDPGARIPAGYESVSVELNDGNKLEGFARAQGSHDLALQTADGKLHVLLDSEYRSITPEKHPSMPAYQGTAEQQRDLLAYLTSLRGVGVGPLKTDQQAV